MASTQDIYLEHFGLTQRPFSLVPDPEFLFWSRAHRGAYRDARIRHGHARPRSP
jgi:general secretion pathway protein A